MHIFLRELKAYQKTTIVWAIALAAGVIMFMALFPAFAIDVEASKKVLENFPPALRAVFNLSLTNFFTVAGFYSYLLTFIVIAGAVQAMVMGVGILAKEISGKTVDFLLTKPVSRVKVVASKMLVGLTLLILTNAIFVSVSILAATIVSTTIFSYQKLILLALTMFLIQTLFFALGLLLSAMLPKIKSAIGVALPTVFTFYIIGALGTVLGNEKVRYITPFKYFDTDYILNHGAYETKYLLIEAVVILVAIIASFVIYNRKDIRAGV